MCAGPVQNLIEDVTGVTAQKNAAKQAMKEQAENMKLSNERYQEMQNIGNQITDVTTQEEETNRLAAARGAEAIGKIKEQAQTQVVVGSSGPSSAQIAARNASISAAQASQGIIAKQKKKRKGLKISPKDAYAKGTGSPGSTSASLKIGSQGTSPGTGTNLPV
tara:strand:- start:167 stop:655 length:489 start_codon:yes stop_codon:yes gene_type:complete